VRAVGARTLPVVVLRTVLTVPEPEGVCDRLPLALLPFLVLIFVCFRVAMPPANHRALSAPRPPEPPASSSRSNAPLAVPR
jgi:hypothetical protein